MTTDPVSRGGASEPEVRFGFANHLRGVAALLVAVLHLGIAYWFDRNGVARSFGVAPTTLLPPVPWFAQTLRGFEHFGTDRVLVDFGALGVALFFLISGLVIPLSLQRLGVARFLLARAIRILPVYALSIALWLLTWRLSQIWIAGSNRPDITAEAVIAKVLLISDLLGQPQFDVVSWTLQIELKFYVVAAALFAMCHDMRFAVLLRFVGAAALSTVTVRVLANLNWLHWPHPSVEAVVAELLLQGAFVSTIFCGQMFLHRLQNKISDSILVLRLTAVQACVVVNFLAYGVKPDVLRTLLTSEFLAICIFYCAMRFWTDTPSRFLDGLAAISYPLYVVHVPVGWFVLMCLERTSLPAIPSLVVALTAVTLSAFALHWLVEQPSLALIRRL